VPPIFDQWDGHIFPARRRTTHGCFSPIIESDHCLGTVAPPVVWIKPQLLHPDNSNPPIGHFALDEDNKRNNNMERQIKIEIVMVVVLTACLSIVVTVAVFYLFFDSIS
jgi:hypothetical protein